MSSDDSLLDELQRREQAAEEGGGPSRQARHKRLGRLTARERIAALVDDGSFTELGKHVKSRHGAASDRLAANLHPGDGMVCGLGAVAGRTVAVWANDPTVLRGAIGRQGAVKLSRLLDLALEQKAPVLALVDSDGMRVEEGTDAVQSLGDIIVRTLRLRDAGVVQLSLVCGLCVGGAAYNAVLTDFVAMVDMQSFMFVTGGKVSKEVTGEDRELVDLGAPDLHAKVTGSCHAVVADEAAGVALLKRVLTFLEPVLPSEDAVERETPALEKLIPVSERRAYDQRRVLAELFDAGSVLELSPAFAPNLLTAFARLGGRAVAVVASQPMQLAGCLDVNASRKGAAFVRWAGRLQLPIITLVDTPGYLPGRQQEEEGILPHGATLLEAYAGVRVPKMSFIFRKSFGGANVLSFAADIRLALPMGTIDVMGSEAALKVVLGPEVSEAQREAWEKAHHTVWAAAEAGYVDRVVAPKEARRELARVLERLAR
ncbi:MAG: methylmalonyl-CoA carboxyltransferase [Myxococcaceae bacterium]|nr:methylmalonyl-CoA carboxyltransferase [Myxococcaceae bacterium]